MIGGEVICGTMSNFRAVYGVGRVEMVIVT